MIHSWGLDFQLGYCAQVTLQIFFNFYESLDYNCDSSTLSQGDRTKNVGVVDSEYIVHLGLLTLGVFNGSEVSLFTH